MSYDYYSIMKRFTRDYNEILDNKKPIDISEEKFQQLLSLLQCEEHYCKSNKVSHEEFFNSKDLLIEYYRICNTLHPVNYKNMTIYFKIKRSEHSINDFSEENANQYIIKNIEVFYQFTTIENLKDSIYIIDSIIQLMDDVNRIFIQENGRDRRSFIRRFKTCQEIGIYHYIQEKTLTFLHLCIDCLKYIKKNHQMDGEISNYISFRYSIGDSFIKMSLPFELVLNNKEVFTCYVIHNIDTFIDIIDSLPVTEKYKEIFKDFIDKDYSRYDKKWKSTKSSRNVIEQ